MKNPAYLFASLSLLFCISCSQHQHEDHEHEHESVSHNEEDSNHHDHDHDHDAHNHESDEDEHHGSEEIILSPKRAAQLGVKVDTVRLTSIDEIVKVTGEVITDPSNLGVVVAPVSGRISLTSSIREGANVNRGQRLAIISGAEINGGDGNTLARIQLDAARREVDRLRPLRDEGIVTAAEFNAAERAYQEAKNAIGSAGGGATAPIAGVITSVNVTNGQYVESGQQIAEIAANGRLTIRADVPKRYAGITKKARTATVRLPYIDRTIDASLTSQPSGAAATSAYQPMYFSVASTNDLSPGSFVEVYINAGNSKPGIMVPLSSVTERLGQKFVYVKIDDEGYERRPVTVGTTDGRNIEITSGLASGDVVVIEGATFVRLAETSNVAPPGHTHNH